MNPYPEEILSATRWCQLFVAEMIDASRMGLTICDGAVVARRLHETHGPWKFPQFRRYDHQLALGFERTKWKK